MAIEWRSVRSVTLGLMIIICIFLTSFLLLARDPLGRAPDDFSSNKLFTSGISHTANENQTWEKPHGFKIIAMVFYGRRRYVEILDCYLKKNLVSNGGHLDEVHFMANTANEKDLEYLDLLLKTSDLYKKIEPRKLNMFDEMWAHATEPGTMYIKIDDDIVYIHESAIPRLVSTLIAHPESHLVSANLINSALSNWLHYHTNAIHAYLPEPNPAPNGHSSPPNWRPSLLPSYPVSSLPTTPWYFPEVPFGGLTTGDPGAPPFSPHRWLPLSPSSSTETNPSEKNLLLTPILGSAYDAEKGIHHQWAIAAQEHYSFLSNLENDRLDLYWAGNRDGVWNLQYQRHNLNFVAVWGESVRSNPPGMQDEADLFVNIPRRLGKPAIIDTHALVSHFSFWPQEKELLTTDLLGRYSAYAEEMVCKR